MTNTGLRSESTGNNYNKVENMWIDYSDDTGAFPNSIRCREVILWVILGHSWQRA